MNGYTVHFKYAKEHVEASDSDMAVWKAAEIIAQDLTEEERGELVAVELHGKNGLSDFYYAMTDMSSDEVDAVVTRKETRPKKAKLPSRRQHGLCLTYEDGDLFVVSFGYSASLSCAYHEELLEYNGAWGREPKQLNAKQNEVVAQWMNHEADYYEQNGWKTWDEFHNQ